MNVKSSQAACRAAPSSGIADKERGEQRPHQAGDGCSRLIKLAE